VTALLAQELEIPLLKSFNNEELVVVPLIIVFLEELGEVLLTGPLDGDPFQLLALPLVVKLNMVLNGQLTIYVIFDLLYRRVSTLSFCSTSILCCQRHLKPVGDFEYISILEGLVNDVHIVGSVCLHWLTAYALQIFPIEYLFIA
jgi:hypothetical protein